MFRSRRHERGRPSYCDCSRNSHDAERQIKAELTFARRVEKATLIAAGPTLINFNAAAMVPLERLAIAYDWPAAGPFTAP
jgi:hypothetical protein